MDGPEYVHDDSTDEGRMDCGAGGGGVCEGAWVGGSAGAAAVVAVFRRGDSRTAVCGGVRAAEVVFPAGEDSAVAAGVLGQSVHQSLDQESDALFCAGSRGVAEVGDALFGAAGADEGAGGEGGGALGGH